MTIGRYGYDLTLGPNPDFQVRETPSVLYVVLKDKKYYIWSQLIRNVEQFRNTVTSLESVR